MTLSQRTASICLALAAALFLTSAQCSTEKPKQEQPKKTRVYRPLVATR